MSSSWGGATDDLSAIGKSFPREVDYTDCRAGPIKDGPCERGGPVTGGIYDTLGSTGSSNSNSTVEEASAGYELTVGMTTTHFCR